MSTPEPAPLSFTKLVVEDLDRMADFYCGVFGLHRIGRLSIEKGAIGEPIEEIFLSPDPSARYGSFVLFKYVNRPAPQVDEVILGFQVGDLRATLGRIEAAGGRRAAPVKEMPELAVRIAMVRDPEGHLCELVEQRA